MKKKMRGFWELEKAVEEYLACVDEKIKNKAAWNAGRRDRAHNKRLKSKYGLSLERFNKMLARQGGKCAVCRKKRKLVVDHCHKTGVVRGLLCNNCNLAEGLVQTPDNVRRMLAYMEANDLFYTCVSRLTQV
jgi:Recombination endonuclease VII